MTFPATQMVHPAAPGLNDCSRSMAISNNHQRMQIARTAARLMREQSIRDFSIAKQKAAERLGIDIRQAQLPRNTEIESALAEHQRLFGGEAADNQLRSLREAAVEAMNLFAEFRPRLVGDVLNGLVHRHTDVQLHLFAQAPELFDLFLDKQGIPFDMTERRFRYGRGEYHYYPTYLFAAGGIGFEAVVFPETGIRQAPDSPVDGNPMVRAKRAEIEQLIAPTQYCG